MKRKVAGTVVTLGSCNKAERRRRREKEKEKEKERKKEKEREGERDVVYEDKQSQS